MSCKCSVRARCATFTSDLLPSVLGSTRLTSFTLCLGARHDQLGWRSFTRFSHFSQHFPRIRSIRAFVLRSSIPLSTECGSVANSKLEQWKLWKPKLETINWRAAEAAAILIYHGGFRTNFTFARCSNWLLNSTAGKGTRTSTTTSKSACTISWWNRYHYEIEIAKSSCNGPRRWYLLESSDDFVHSTHCNVLSGLLWCWWGTCERYYWI